jgi:hypothetical protein
MACDRYELVPESGGWALRLNGQDLNWFEEQNRALHAAAVAARMSETRGRAVDITVQDGSALKIDLVSLD